MINLYSESYSPTNDVMFTFGCCQPRGQHADRRT